MTTDKIQSLWIGDSLSVLEQLSIASFLANGHAYHLYTYQDVDNIPDGATVCDANEILPESKVFKTRSGSYAIFADWFRWKMLYAVGGYWADTDVICLKPFTFDSELVFGKEHATLAAIGVLRFPAKHWFSELMADCCENPNVLRPFDDKRTRQRKIRRRIFSPGKRGNAKWGESGGPAGMTRALKHFGLFDQAKPFTYFYPISAENWDSIFDETLGNDMDLFSQSYAIHIWNEMLRLRSDLDKSSSFPENSLIERLKKRYL